jgi:hypothetical protein
MVNSYTAAERTQLASVLGCSTKELDDQLKGFVDAAEEEYVRMMLGQHVYSRGQNIRVYRLCLLIKHAFGGRLPNEGEISAIFQTTTTESRSLLRAVRAKFQYELRQATHDTMSAVFAQATRDPDADTWSLVCGSENAGEYEIAASTHDVLNSIL